MYNTIFSTLLFLNLASAGLVTGGVMVMAFAYTPLLAELPQRESILIHQGIGRYVDRWQPKLAWVALFSGIVEIFFTRQAWQFTFVMLGIAGILGLIIISITTSIPLAQKIVAWTPESGTALEQLKMRWIRVHYLRSTSGLLGFLFLLTSVLLLIHY